MPGAGGCQVAVTTSIQVSSAAKTQPGSDLNIEMKQRRGRGKEEQGGDRRGRGGEYVIYLRLRVERVKGWSSFHMSQPCSSQPSSLEGEEKKARRESGMGSTEATLQIIQQ